MQVILLLQLSSASTMYQCLILLKIKYLVMGMDIGFFCDIYPFAFYNIKCQILELHAERAISIMFKAITNSYNIYYMQQVIWLDFSTSLNVWLKGV